MLPFFFFLVKIAYGTAFIGKIKILHWNEKYTWKVDFNFCRWSCTPASNRLLLLNWQVIIYKSVMYPVPPVDMFRYLQASGSLWKRSFLAIHLKSSQVHILWITTGGAKNMQMLFCRYHGGSCEMLSLPDASWICCYGLWHGFRIHRFKPILLWLSRFVQTEWHFLKTFFTVVAF